VKRKDLIKAIEGKGCIFIRHGSKHDWYQNPKTKISQPVPRHREINDRLAQHIIKMLSNDNG
jgi:mRNA interferase HicA